MNVESPTLAKHRHWLEAPFRLCGALPDVALGLSGMAAPKNESKNDKNPWDSLTDVQDSTEKTEFDVKDLDLKNLETKSPDVQIFDFRSGKMPPGIVSVASGYGLGVQGEGFGQASLEVQQDKSHALVLPPCTWLRIPSTSAHISI